MLPYETGENAQTVEREKRVRRPLLSSRLGLLATYEVHRTPRRISQDLPGSQDSQTNRLRKWTDGSWLLCPIRWTSRLGPMAREKGETNTTTMTSR